MEVIFVVRLLSFPRSAAPSSVWISCTTPHGDLTELFRLTHSRWILFLLLVMLKVPKWCYSLNVFRKNVLQISTIPFFSYFLHSVSHQPARSYKSWADVRSRMHSPLLFQVKGYMHKSVCALFVGKRVFFFNFRLCVHNFIPFSRLPTERGRVTGLAICIQVRFTTDGYLPQHACLLIRGESS